MRRPAALLAAAVLFASVLLGALGARAPDGPSRTEKLTLPEYLTELRSVSETLDRHDPAAMRALQGVLPDEWAIESGSQSFEVKIDWLKAALAASADATGPTAERARQNARQRVAALEESAEAFAAAERAAASNGSPDLAQERARVERILSAPEFQGSHELSWFDKLKKRVSDWFTKYFGKYFERLGIPAPVGNGIAWGLIVVAAALLAWWTIRALLASPSLSRMDLGNAASAGQDWRFWAREARAAAERGDYRAAIHAAYWTGVARLEEYRLLPADRSRTPRESLRLVAEGNGAYRPLLELTRRLELTWYGYRAATAEDWRAAMREVEAIECLRSSTPAIAA